MYRWIVYLHLISVFIFLLHHGLEIAVMFKLRKQQTDPAAVFTTLGLLDDFLPINALLFVRIIYATIIITGLTAGFMSVWWRQGWMWTALGLMIIIGIVMNRVGLRYYISATGAANNVLKNKDDASAMEKFNAAKNTKAPEILVASGFLGGLIILWLMMFKPF